MANTLTQKVVLYPCNADGSAATKEKVTEVYNSIREGMKNQNNAMNLYMSALYADYMLEFTADKENGQQELNRLFARNSDSKSGSGYTDDIQFPVGFDTASQLSQKVKQDFKGSVSKGLKYGTVSLITYRNTNPLLIHKKYVQIKGSTAPRENKKTGAITEKKYTKGFYHLYDSSGEFVKALNEEEPLVLLDFPNDMTFKLVFGNKKKSQSLRFAIQAMFEGVYKPCGSSIQFDRSGKKIILNLVLETPTIEHKLDEKVVVGVDLGLAIPAVCALNNSPYVRENIGYKDSLLQKRLAIQRERKAIYRRMRSEGRGGHGRERKFGSKLKQISEKERRFVHNKNHEFSRRVVDFAIKQGAKYINIEDLSGFRSSKKKKKSGTTDICLVKETTQDFVLRNWSYFELQTMITYKAKQHGIIVRKVRPAYTSQTCSVCGHYEEGQRPTQAEFICKNPNCKNYGKVVNADFNAARNIALSTAFVTDKQIEQEEKLFEQTPVGDLAV